MDESRRSRFSGKPGSLMAIRVNYGSKQAAFEPLPSDHPNLKTKKEVRKWKQGHRLGDPVEWNQSTDADGQGGHPQRALMHRLSEYQSVKMEYNYRAQTLPQVNKQTIFVPKPSKMEIDKKIFVREEDKAKVVDKCPATVSKLSYFEMQNDGDALAGVDREHGWNTSVELDADRTNIFKSRGYDDFRAVNKTKPILNHETYVSPQRRQVEMSKAVREAKLAEREATRRARQEELDRKAGRLNNDEPVFKMSNVETWWDKVPANIAEKAQTLPSVQEQKQQQQQQQQQPQQSEGGTANGGQ